MKSILLTGGTGLIGGRLTEALLAKGYKVSHLSRTPGKDSRVKTFLWNVQKGEIDANCIEGVDTIVHLAGAGVAEKRWTDARKKLLIESRTKSIGLIYHLLNVYPNEVKSIISASATGYYGDRGDELLTEESKSAHDFLGTCCIDWERAVESGAGLGLRIVKFRTGIVLNKEGGALPQLAMPVRLFVGSALGSGKQWTPWIHWQDVIAMYLFGIENDNLRGVFNMVAPNPVTNAQMVKVIARQFNRPLWAPKVPAFVLNTLLGEMSVVALASSNVAADKITAAGFKFKYTHIEEALKEIYG